MKTAAFDSNLAQGSIPCASTIAGRGVELLVLVAILVVCNLHLVSGTFPSSTAFLPDCVAAGEWWRVFTHAFAHLSWYHLVLDGAAFLFLYHSLPLPTRVARLGLLVAATSSSLAAAAFTDPRVTSIGFCGLSGAAHGLMVVVALDEIRSIDRTRTRLGSIVLAGLIVKCIFEAITGGVLFAGAHLGSVGTPIGVCHGGGAIGGLIVGLMVHRRRT